jgi:hypothetical protein
MDSTQAVSEGGFSYKYCPPSPDITSHCPASGAWPADEQQLLLTACSHLRAQHAGQDDAMLSRSLTGNYRVWARPEEGKVLNRALSGGGSKGPRWMMRKLDVFGVMRKAMSQGARRLHLGCARAPAALYVLPPYLHRCASHVRAR